MSWWSERKPAQILQIEPPIDRQADALAKVRMLKSQMNSLDAEILEFKTLHRAKVSRFGVLLSVHSPSMNGYEGIRCAWDALLRRRDAIVSQWHAALRDWAEAKGQTK